MSNITKFCNTNISLIEDLIDVMEQESDDLYLTDKEWDEVHEQVIDPLYKIITRLESIRDDQPDDIDE